MTTIDYREATVETISAMAEGRVLMISSANGRRPNAMAIGWGSAGILWNRPVFTALVRPSRHTWTLVEESGDFTINVMPPALKEFVTFCGTASGREHDKFRARDRALVPSLTVGAPTAADALCAWECRVIGRQDLAPESLGRTIREKHYAGGDYHRLFFGEITACRRR